MGEYIFAAVALLIGFFFGYLCGRSEMIDSDVIWCEDCRHFENPDMGSEVDCSVLGLHTWYGRSISYCPYFKRKKKED